MFEKHTLVRSKFKKNDSIGYQDGIIYLFVLIILSYREKLIWK